MITYTNLRKDFTDWLTDWRNSWCLGEFEKAVEAQYFSFFHSCFYNSKETRYMFSIS